MSPEPARELQIPFTQPSQEEVPQTQDESPISLTRKKTESVWGSALKKSADYLEIKKPDILDGDQDNPVVSYGFKDGGKAIACLKGAEGHTNSNVVMVDPQNDSFAVIQGVGQFGEQRLAAKEYAKAFKKYKNPFRGQVEAEKKISEYGIKGGASYIYGKILKDEDGKKYLWTGSLGDDVLCVVYDKSGAIKARSDYDDKIPLEKGDRVLTMSRQMDIRPDIESFASESLKNVVNQIRKATAEKPVDQAFVLMEIQ